MRRYTGIGTIAIAALCVALAGCAVMPTGDRESADDPLEPVNRVVLDTNTALDTAIIKPVAELYRQIVPPFVRDRIRSARRRAFASVSASPSS